MIVLTIELTGQLLVTVIVVILAVVLFVRALRRPGGSCHDSCTGCSLHDSCASAGRGVRREKNSCEDCRKKVQKK